MVKYRYVECDVLEMARFLWRVTESTNLRFSPPFESILLTVL